MGFFPCSLNCRVLSMLTAVHTHHCVPGCSSRHRTRSSCWRCSVQAPLSLSCLAFVIFYLSCSSVIFPLLFQVLAVFPVGSFFKFNTLKSHFWHQPNLFAPHHYPRHQSPTQAAALPASVHLFLSSYQFTSILYITRSSTVAWHMTFILKPSKYLWTTFLWNILSE